MKRALKIIGITLASIIGIVLIAASIAIWVVFTPERLTPIARQVADKFVSCEYEIGEVDLTFFSTFPEFGLRADGICLVNPVPGAPSDTLLTAPKVVATVNVTDFLMHNNLTIREVSLKEMEANIFIDANGQTNYDVFITSPDTTEDEAFQLPFDNISVSSLSLTANSLTFINKKDTITASLHNTEIESTIGSWDDILFSLHSDDVNVNLKGTQYADHLHLGFDMDAAVNLETMHLELDKSTLAINEFEIALNGMADIHDTIHLDTHFATNTWQIKPLLALLPAPIAQSLKDISADGEMQLEADIRGEYADSIMPLVDAQLAIAKAEADYKPLPYHLRDIQLKADAHLDLNNDSASYVTINQLKAKTKDTKLEATGQITELLADMLLDLHLKLDANLPDFVYFLPKDMVVNGRTKGEANAKIRLSDLTELNFENGHLSGNLTLQDIDFRMDSMSASLPYTSLAFEIPNTHPAHKTNDWLHATICFDKLNYQMTGMLNAQLGKTQLDVETGDLISGSHILTAGLTLQSQDPLVAAMDSIDATIAQPLITAYAEYDTKDSTHIPVLQATVDFADLKGHYTDIMAHLSTSTLKASISGGRRNKSIPHLAASIHSNSIEASMGNDLSVTTQKIAIDAAARYNKKGKNILLQWNPSLKVDLHEAVANTSDLSLPIRIPEMNFAYSNKDFLINSSRMVIGNSDFSLTGEVQNIGKWLREKGVLEGKLDFVSSHTDVNQLLTLFSADKGSEEKSSTTTETTTEKTVETKEAYPFMVPTSVDLTLNTHIEEADIFNEVAHNLRGRIYIKDGKLVLEEMGFVCNAAKLQLTAMYRTPRRNHIYIGFDYHMLDIDIHELVTMIPQLDSMMPMLQSFKGAAEFHLAAETYLNAKYELKTSTLRGACSIFGKDLVVMDNETFSTISKLLMFKKKTENKVDSLSAEITLYKDEIDIYPFTVSMDNYTAALGGRHNLDMSFDYHVSLLSPFYIGVDVKGTFDNLQIKPTKCKYAKDFKPMYHRDVDTQSAELRSIIRESMRKNVKIQ